jgi:hypothetical protein
VGINLIVLGLKSDVFIQFKTLIGFVENYWVFGLHPLSGILKPRSSDSG